MLNKIIGSIFLILGTCIGAGMLAIPIVTTPESFGLSVLLLFIAWLVMTIGAFAILEVNLCFKPGSNLISMAEATLGKLGKMITSFVYLLLMYSLICAYLSSASGITQMLMSFAHCNISRTLATIITLSLLGAVVYQGMGTVDIVNRLLMSIKCILFIVIVVMLAPHLQLNALTEGHIQVKNTAFIVMITSFGYAIILPTLRQYLGSDRKLLKRVVLIGSLIPFFVFFLWMIAVKGALPHHGSDGLLAMLKSDNATSLLMLAIAKTLQSHWVKYIANIFVSIFVLTSFVCVSISLVDFIADGLKKTKQGKDNLIIHLLCFLPPLAIVLVKPGIFITALAYSGILCIILLIILPLLMLYSSRYKSALSEHHLLPGGRSFLSAVLVFAFLFLTMQFVF